MKLDALKMCFFILKGGGGGGGGNGQGWVNKYCWLNGWILPKHLPNKNLDGFIFLLPIERNCLEKIDYASLVESNQGCRVWMMKTKSSFSLQSNQAQIECDAKKETQKTELTSRELTEWI